MRSITTHFAAAALALAGLLGAGQAAHAAAFINNDSSQTVRFQVRFADQSVWHLVTLGPGDRDRLLFNDVNNAAAVVIRTAHGNLVVTRTAVVHDGGFYSIRVNPEHNFSLYNGL
ncbi:MAG: hypothetical protein ACP5NI_07240 [Acetobacteraceae bacterium]